MRISIDDAVSYLQSAQVVALPTETVYGLAASIEHPNALEAIFTIKGRPKNNPLIVHLSSIEQLHLYTETLPPKTLELARAFWPGPLTLVLPADKNRISSLIRASLPTAAFRIPNHHDTLSIIDRIGPLVMPSANRSGSPSATCAQHVEDDFGSKFPVVDGGCCAGGIESTVLIYETTQWVVGRKGAIDDDALAIVLGYMPLEGYVKKRPLCPGQHYRHYAPRARLNLCEDKADLQGVVVGYRERYYPRAGRVLFLGSIGDPDTVAYTLYALLRQLDREGIEEVNVDFDVPSHGLWQTIRERLKKAASLT